MKNNCFLLVVFFCLASTLSCSNNTNNGSSDSSSSNGSGSSSSEDVNPSYIDKGNSILSYKTTKIDDLNWMAENLNYKVPGSKCYGEGGLVFVELDHYNNTTITLSDAQIQSNCDKYGRLYDWATAMALPSSCNSVSCEEQINNPHRGICPEGWHIPSYEEWNALFFYVDNVSGKLKSAGDEWISPHTGSSFPGTDEYGFSALPGGRHFWGDPFEALGNYGHWWISTEYNSNFVLVRYMSYSGDYADQASTLFYKSTLFSVRCLQD